jgi:hypothetical protein
MTLKSEEIELRFPLADDGERAFLSCTFLSREEDATIIIGLQKHNGECYAFSRLTEEQFRRAVHRLFPNEQGTSI